MAYERIDEVLHKLHTHTHTTAAAHPFCICTMGTERSIRTDGIAFTITSRVDDGNHLILVKDE